MVALAVALAAALMMLVEARQPGRCWPVVAGWWARVAALNAVQVALVLMAAAWLDPWLLARRPWPSALGPVGGALCGYLALTFVFYWWHRARHASPWLWRTFHQLHHSVERVEVAASFYKHPLEIAANAVICSAVLLAGLGLSQEAAAGAVLLSGLAELVYHWNVHTPAWLGYLFQRPESHCLHHQEGVHAFNYGDLPLWDMLFGTFRNPQHWNARCGLGHEARGRFADMLRGVDVSAPEPQRPPRPGRVRLVLAIGLAGMLADLLDLSPLRAAARASQAAPAPRVFTAVRGYEALSTGYEVTWRDTEAREDSLLLTPEAASRLRGPYNRRNVYGAALSFGPVLAGEPRTEALRAAVWRQGLCGQAPLLRELGLRPGRVAEAAVRYRTRDGASSELRVVCR